MTTPNALVLGFYRDDRSANEALARLGEKSQHRAALIRHTADGRTQIEAENPSPTPAAAIGSAVGLVAGALLPLPLASARTTRTLISSGGALAGLVAGRFLARRFDSGLSDETLQLYARWVMRGENLVLV